MRLICFYHKIYKNMSYIRTLGVASWGALGFFEIVGDHRLMLRIPKEHGFFFLISAFFVYLNRNIYNTTKYIQIRYTNLYSYVAQRFDYA